METLEYAGSIQGVAIRVTGLDAAGNLQNGPGDSYTTSAFMRVSFTPEYEEGDELSEKNASGAIAVTYKVPDTLKRITMELAITEPDPELTNLLSGGLLLRKNLGTFANPLDRSVGWASPGVGDDPAGYGVAIEAWSFAVKDGKKDSKLPYFYWVFPYVKVRQSGDRVIENGILATTFQGYGLGNTNFRSGPDGRWEFPTAAERPYSYARASWAPTGLQGFYQWNDGVNDPLTVSAKQVAGGVAVLQFDAPVSTNPISLGDQIYVNLGDNGFDGLQTVTATAGTNGAWTANFATSSANVANVAVTANPTLGTGLVYVVNPGTESPSYTAVTNLDTVFGSWTVTNKYANSSAAILTTSLPHGIKVGDKISVTGVDSTFNTATPQTVTAVTDYTVAFALAATVANTAASGTVLANPSTSATAFNVPGNKNYNADNPIDRVIRSNEDPTS